MEGLFSDRITNLLPIDTCVYLVFEKYRLQLENAYVIQNEAKLTLHKTKATLKDGQ